MGWVIFWVAVVFFGGGLWCGVILTDAWWREKQAAHR